VTDAQVVGLTDDGARVVLRVGDETVEVPLIEVHRAERHGVVVRAHREDPTGALTPRLIQHRIRCGESAQEVAEEAGWPIADVARYEGPVLAEREHHARAARSAEVDGQQVEALVVAYLGVPAEVIEWDSWLVSPGRWDVVAGAGGRTVRLRWEPVARRVVAADEASRRALKQAAAGDALTAVLRPVSTSDEVGGAGELIAPPTPPQAAPPAAPAPPAPAPPAPTPIRQPRRARAQVPLWSDISLQVSGRESGGPDE
jgi:hypothetical protein